MTETTDQQIEALRRELKLIWDGHEREHKLHDEAHSREHEFTAEALRVAAAMAKENKADANEWRGTMTDRERSFATKKDVEVLGEKIDKLEEAEIRRVEAERLRVINEAKIKEDTDRRADVRVRNLAIIVGVLTTAGSILVGLVIRLAFPDVPAP